MVGRSALVLGVWLAWEGYSQNACFSLSDTVVCVPATISVTECTNGGTNIRYDYGVGQGYVTQTSHTYTQTGVYEIKQLISSVGNNVNLTSRKIRVVSIPTLSAVLKACVGFELSTIVLSDFYPEYSVKYFGFADQVVPPFQEARAVFSQGGLQTVVVEAFSAAPSCNQRIELQSELLEVLEKPTLTNLVQNANGSWRLSGSKSRWNEVQLLNENGIVAKVGVGQLGFELAVPKKNTSECLLASSYDTCGSRVNGNSLCTHYLKGEVQSGFNTLHWGAGFKEGFVRYELSRNGSLVFSSTASDDTLFVDANVLCGSTYCYQLKVVSESGEVLTKDTCLLATNLTKPNALNDAYVTYDNGQYSLYWPPSNAIKEVYFLNSAKQRLGTQSNGSSVKLPNQGQCFYVVYQNSCGVVSDTTEPICKSILYTDGKDLVWTEIAGAVEYQLVEWVKGVEQVVYSGESSRFPLISLDSSASLSVYQVISKLSSGQELRSNPFEVNRSPFIAFPNVFSPNGDGINDEFLPVYRFLNRYQLVILDQWGGIVFVSKDPKRGWNGEGATANVPYVYVCEYLLEDGKSDKITGTVQLLK